MTGSRQWRWAAVALVVFLSAVCLRRAATQSIVSAEWDLHSRAIGLAASPSHGGMAAPAAAVMSAVAGVSEFSLRLPDVVGGILFFTGLFLLGRLAFGDSPWLPLTVALGGLNPFALDVCSMAAGRGLGLGCWTLAAYLTARWVADGRPIPSLAGALLGLAAAADPQQCFGVAALEIGLLV